MATQRLAKLLKCTLTEAKKYIQRIKLQAGESISAKDVVDAYMFLKSEKVLFKRMRHKDVATEALRIANQRKATRTNWEPVGVERTRRKSKGSGKSTYPYTPSELKRERRKAFTEPHQDKWDFEELKYKPRPAIKAFIYRDRGKFGWWY